MGGLYWGPQPTGTGQYIFLWGIFILRVHVYFDSNEISHPLQNKCHIFPSRVSGRGYGIGPVYVCVSVCM